MNHPKNKTNVERYMAVSAKLFNRLPQQKPPNRDVLTSSATLGTLFGLANYVVGPAVFHLDRSGNQDEMSAILAAAAGVVIGSIRAFCQTENGEPPKKFTQRLKKLWNLGAGGLAGGTLTASFVPFFGMLTLSAAAPWLLGGAVLGAGVFGVRHEITKRKYCKHCRHRGKCTQRVCRGCGRLFWPKEEKLDRENGGFLDWSRVASFLQTAYGLTYLQAEALAREFFDKWLIKTDKNNVEVSCAKFVEWASENESLIADFKREHVIDMTSKVADDLDSRGL